MCHNIQRTAHIIWLTAALSVTAIGANSQNFTVLHTFSLYPVYTSGPDVSLILSGNTLYGTTSQGGPAGNGTVFTVGTNGSGFTILYSFNAVDTNQFNSDGADPVGALVLSGNTLYGTTSAAGPYGGGTVFSINIDGLGFSNLYSFTNGTDGAYPQAGLILSGNTLYGTASSGGLDGNGTVFSVKTNGLGFSNLYSFTNGTDGAYPQAGLTLSDNTLYGTAYNGGLAGNGTVFEVNTDGSGFATLYSFSAEDANGFNSDGANPSAGLILSGNALYGTAFDGGLAGNGTVFSVNTNGSASTFKTLYSFTALDSDTSTNTDGAYPAASLILSGNTLYGTASQGGYEDGGTVFGINTESLVFSNLYSFTGGTGGSYPQAAGLILSGNTLYGTTSAGDFVYVNDGTVFSGTVFSVMTNGSGFSNLCAFVGILDGANPEAGLILSGNTLYGTASAGGLGEYFDGGADYGTVFKVNTNGSGYGTVYSFTNGLDGFAPFASLTLSGNALYGTAYSGGFYNIDNAGDFGGTVFKVNTDGSGFTNLYDFPNASGGANPQAGLILSGNTLYGTTSQYGPAGNGTVFEVNISGAGYSNVYNFTGNNDGSSPEASLVLSGNTLYGTTFYGGPYEHGVVFKVNTDGSGYSNVYSFTGGTDGAYPVASLVLSGNTLYGTTQGGDTNYLMGDGQYHDSTVFKVNTDGSGFTNLHSFTASDPVYDGTNTDGANPRAGLILSGNTLYGTTFRGGLGGNGTVFEINTDGSGFTTLYSFSAVDTNYPYVNSDGVHPAASLILSGNTLYGTASGGGLAGGGTVFALSLASVGSVPLNIQLLGNKVVLSWSNPVFALQAAPKVQGTYTNVTGATSPYTNAITGSQQFFRLQASP